MTLHVDIYNFNFLFFGWTLHYIILSINLSYPSERTVVLIASGLLTVSRTGRTTLHNLNTGHANRPCNIKNKLGTKKPKC